MNDKDTKVPEIRFQGFTDAWEQRKLGDVTKSYSGGTPSVDVSEYYGGRIPFIRSAEINSDSTELFLTDSGLANSSAKMVNVGDILYALYGATSGEVGIAQLQGAINQAILAIIPDYGYDSQFIMQWLRGHKQKIVDKYLQGGQGNLSGSLVKDLLVQFPKHDEQRTIGTFFRDLDHLITLHKRKLDGLKELKHGYLQQMFPKKGESMPRVRFAGVTEDWIMRKLGEVVNINPRSFLPGSFEYVDLESVVGTSLISHRAENKDTAPSRAQRVAKSGDIFFQMVRPYQRNNYLFNLPFDNFVFSTGYAQLRPQIDSYFLFCTLQEERFVTKVLDHCTGTSYPAINSTDLAEIYVNIAIEEAEQTAIGNFFRNLDNQITVQKQKLDQLKQLKGAYLKKMFI